MADPWEMLRSVAIEAMGPLWTEFAKNGQEIAVFAPLGRFPNAAAWLAGSMAMSSDVIARKLGAMLAGWVDNPEHSSLLSEMLDRERQVFGEDRLIANSVGEDIMFAATRWAGSRNVHVKAAGIQVLASMIRDALEGTPWNTAHWAVANLYHATKGNHEILRELAIARESGLEGQQYLKETISALRTNDIQTLSRFHARPSGPCPLSPDSPHYSIVMSLWEAAELAEASLG